MIQTLLRPALYLMARLRLGSKFALIIGLCITPVIVLSLIALNNINEEIIFAEREQNGLKLVPPLKQLLLHLSEARSQIEGNQEGITVSENALLTHDKIDQHLSVIDKLTKRYLSSALHNEFRSNILKSWQSLKTNQNISYEDQFEAYSKLISQALEYINDVAFATHLFQEPEASNALLIDITIRQIPILIENIAQLRDLGARIISNRSLSNSHDRITTAINRIELLHHTFEKSAKNINTTNRELGKLYKTTDDAIHEFIHLTEQFTLSSNISHITTTLFVNTANHAIDSDLNFFNIAIKTIEKSLHTRVKVSHRIELAASITIVSTISLLIYVLIAFYCSITNKLNRLLESATRIAAGDLTEKVSLNTKDELNDIGIALNKISAGINRTVFSIISTSNLFVDVACRLTESSRLTENSVSSQVTDSIATAQSITTLSSTVQEVTASIAKAAESAQQADKETNNGQLVVKETITSILDLANGLEQVSNVIYQLKKDSMEISGILKVIQEIADQTNLLALNAAIEAARAGEHGRGFAVVADEVRDLARKTQDSTLEIQGMIEQLQTASNDAVNVMQKSSQQASQSVEHAKSAGTVLQEITHLVSSISDMNSRISIAAQNQNQMAQQLDNNMVNMTSAANQSSAVAKSSVEDSSRVKALASETQSLLHRFLVNLTAEDIEEGNKHILFEWDESFSVGLPEIDRQHKILINMINELNYHVRMKHNASYINRILQGLIDYTVSHFGYEEGLMERHGYKHLAEHKEKHKKLINQILEFQYRVNSNNNDEEIVEELLNFLNEWLSKHIKGTDKDYAKILVAMGVDQENSRQPTDVISDDNIDLF